MNIGEMVENFVSQFGFDYQNHTVIINDLKKIIIAQFLANIMEKHPSNEDVTMLRKAMDVDDIESAERILNSIFRSSEYKVEIMEISDQILHQWLSAVQDVLTEDQKARQEKALAVLTAYVVN